jgi:hypothetical protein
VAYTEAIRIVLGGQFKVTGRRLIRASSL